MARTDEYMLFSDKASYNSLMPKLRNDGFNALSTSDFLRMRLLAANGNSGSIDYNGRFDTCDGVICYSGNVIVVPRATALMDITANTPLYNGGIQIKESELDSIGLSIPRPQLSNQGLNNFLTLDSFILHTFWNAIVQDTALLHEYGSFAYSAINEKHKNAKDKKNEGLGVFVAAEDKVPVIRAVSINLFPYSILMASGSLDMGYATLVGKKGD